MTKSYELMDAESNWTNRIAVLETTPRPLSQKERDLARREKLAELRKARLVARIWSLVQIAVVSLIGALLFSFMPNDWGGAIMGAIVGAGCGVLSLWMLWASSFTDSSPFRREREMNEEAREYAFPALASGPQLDEVTALVRTIPELHEIARQWLERGPLSVREYEDLKQAGRVHQRLVEHREAEKQRKQSGDRLANAIIDAAA